MQFLETVTGKKMNIWEPLFENVFSECSSSCSSSRSSGGGGSGSSNSCCLLLLLLPTNFQVFTALLLRGCSCGCSTVSLANQSLDISRNHGDLETSGTNFPVTWHCLPEEWIPLEVHLQ
jgi:hypothetical protein